jgi:hypothetical protein
MAKNQRRQLEKSKNERRQLEKERQELLRQLPGLESLLAFLRAAGISVELGPGRWLWINGVQAEHLTHLPPPETLEWNSIISEIALKYLRTKFIRAVEDNARCVEGVRTVLLPREKGFAIMRGDVPLAIIHAARAQIPHREGIRANFLIPGPLWRVLADVVHGAEGELLAEWERLPVSRPGRLPGYPAMAGDGAVLLPLRTRVAAGSCRCRGSIGRPRSGRLARCPSSSIPSPAACPAAPRLSSCNSAWL